MNDRIKQLAKQAGFEIDYFGYAYCEDGGNPNVEGFAELIIKEVAEFVGKQRNDIPCTGEEMANSITFYYEVE